MTEEVLPEIADRGGEAPSGEGAPDPQQTRPRFAVGIGASAGGLEALEQLFKNTPVFENCAFFVVTHLSPDFKSLLDELLQRHTEMHVEIAEHGKQIRPACVYIIPPKLEMAIAAGRIFLQDRDRKLPQPLPVDVFFRSLALEYGPSAIAVILSGTGSDGADAIQSVEKRGGLTIVQDPDEAKFNGMPKAALGTGAVAAIARASEIGGIIAEHIRNGGSTPHRKSGTPRDRRLDEINRVLEIVHGTSNADFSLYKINTIYRRILRRLAAVRCESLQDYIEHLLADPEEQSVLAGDLLIGVTEFFRDREAFRLLREMVISRLVRETGEKRTLRVWVPGCATGEEAYSIAIMIYQEAREKGIAVDPQIFATDLSPASVEKAARGVYSREQLEGIESSIIDTCFEKLDGGLYRIASHIRRWIVFSRHNFLSDPPFTRMDLISCRNALIYLEAEAQQQALSLFNFGLRHKGCLFLGPSETLGVQADDFDVLSRRWRIFAKVGSTAASSQPNSRPRQLPSRRFVRGQEAPEPAVRATRLPPGYAELLEHFISAGVLVNRSNDVIHIFGAAGRFLQAPSGAMSPNILGMVASELRIPLSTALEKAAAVDQVVAFPGIPGPRDGLFDLKVTPLLRHEGGETRHYLVNIDEAGIEENTAARRGERQAIVVEGTAFATERVETLQRELESTRENLQSTIEEVETSNEELQSTNEELMAANEELQSTNEELQSVNEELYTVNSEYQHKNDELVDLTHQIENLMSATNIGVIFVDDRLLLKRFTSAATQIVNFIAQDIGRSLEHITHSLVNIDLPAMVFRSLRSRKSVSAERMSTDGRWWEIRINPMRAAKGRADGAVITFYDISSVKDAEFELVERSNEMRIVGELIGAQAVSHDPDFHFASPQIGWTTIVGQVAETSRGEGWLDAIVPEDREQLRSQLPTAVRGGEKLVQFEFRVVDGTGTRLIKMISRRENSTDGQHLGWSSVIVDVECAGNSIRSLPAREQYVDAVLRSNPAPIFYVDAYQCLRYANDPWLNEQKFSRRNVIGKALSAVVPDEEYQEHLPHIQRALGGDRVERRQRRKGRDGVVTLSSLIYEPDTDDEGNVCGVVVQVRELTGLLHEITRITNSETAIGRGFANSPLPFALISLKSMKPVFVSPALVTLSGYPALMLTQIGMGSLFADWDKESIQQHVAVARDSNDVATIKTELYPRSGAEVPVSVRIAADPADPDQALLIISDLRPLLRSEAAVKSRTADLAKTNRTMEIFAAGASHELKAPLRKIRKFADILIEDHHASLGEEGAEILGVIDRSAKRMREIVDSILELTRLERDHLEAHDVELDVVLENILVDNSTLIEDTKAVVEVGPLPEIRGDRRLLEILFGNLVRNALIHGSDGRRIKVEVAELETEEDGMATIAVQDDGKGIAPEFVDRVFEPFVQCGSNVEGSGMGLALCESVATKHGGSIVLDGSQERGCRFIVTLPRGGSGR